MPDRSYSPPGSLRIGIDARYINDRFPGIGRYLHGLLTGLADLATAHRFVVLVSSTTPNTRFDLTRLAAAPSIQLVSLDAPTISLAEQISVPRTVAKLGLDLMHCPYYVTPVSLPVPRVLTLYDTIPHLFPQDYPALSRLAIRSMTRLVAHRSVHTMVISESTLRHAEQHLGLSPDRMTVTYLGVSSAFKPQPQNAIAAIRSHFDLLHQYVLYVGTFKPHKNIGRLLEAWKSLELPSSRQLVLAGIGSRSHPAPEALIAELGLTSSVRLLESVPEAMLPPLYSGASAFVFPSLHEGFGLPVLEAMACGAPVVCSRSSSLPEVVGRAAILFDPLQVSDIGRALNELLSSPARCDVLAQQGIARATQFTWSKTAKATLSVYESVARFRPMIPVPK